MGQHRKPSQLHDEEQGAGGGEEESEHGEPESEDVKFGEQLQDDLINSFCDKLQSVCPRRIEALLAIQFLMISSNDDVKNHVSGRKDAIQVLYDQTRRHYVLVHYNPKLHHVVLFDSLQPYDNSEEPKMIKEIGTQIGHLFGHLFDKYITVLVDKEYERQSDDFSCGYRCIGALVDLARQKNPSNYRYSRRACLSFLKEVLKEANPTWKLFEKAEFGKRKEYSGNHRILFHVPNTTFVGISSSSSTASRASSTTSLPGKRASAGLYRNAEELEDDDVTLDGLQMPILLNPTPSVGFFDFLLAVYHTPLTFKSFFRLKSEIEEASIVEEVHKVLEN